MDPLRLTGPQSHIPLKLIFARRDPSTREVIASAQGTGFLWSAIDQSWLISNLHNFSGWDHSKNEAMSKTTGFLPNEVQVHFGLSKAAGENDSEGRPIVNLFRRQAVIPLTGEEDRPEWFIHPVHGTAVDVAALPVGKIEPASIWKSEDMTDVELATQHANKVDDWMDYEVTAGDDAFVVGYPMGLDGGGGFAIWKRASIASEPAFDLGKLPRLLVDASARRGMSGSPVWAIRSGLVVPRGGTLQQGVFGPAAHLLGIYSGRLDDDPMGASLGYVWKIRTVDEIIAGGVKDVRPWHKS